MDKVSEREKSSKRARDERSDYAMRDREREKERKHRSREADDKLSSKEEKHRDDDRHHRHRHHHRSDRDFKREHSHEPRDYKSRSKLSPDEREGSYDRDSKRERSYDMRDEREGSRDKESSKRDRSRELRNEREGSKDRGLHVKRRQSDDEYERERSNEPPRDSSYSSKRKEREGSEERGTGRDKKSRLSDDVKERRHFEAEKEVNGSEREMKKERRKLDDEVKDGEANLSRKGERRERRRFDDRVKEERAGDVEDRINVSDVNVKVKEECADERVSGAFTANGGNSSGSGSMVELIATELRSVDTSLPPNYPPPTKVSSISTTNENKGVSIARSHEVPGKSSTDGMSSTAGKSGSISLDALAKAKKALQIQRELAEKLKKIPQLKKPSSTDAEGSTVSELKEAATAPGEKSGILGPAPPSSAVMTASPGLVPSSSTLPAANYEAVKRAQELAARMGFRQDPQFAPLINLFPGQVTRDITLPQKPTRAPVLRLDPLGREIDEHGNVVNITKPSELSTLKVNINKQKKDAFQILKPELEVDPESNPHFDARMGINKTKILRPKRSSFLFVEEGKWSKEAENLKLKSKFGEAQAKERREKQAQLAKAKAAPDINPNLIEVSERVITKEKQKDPIPDIEWWDVPLLHSANYDDLNDSMIVEINGTMITEEKLRKDKVTIYVEHPRPIEPPAEVAPPPPQPLKLTKKEQKKLRTQRRLAREKDRQEMIRQGLIEPPKPKVKMSNLMKVLGSEATQDPTRLEKEIRTAAAEREQAHIDRNIARKLTPAERREKKERKLFDDPSTLESLVSVYKINNLSHPQARFKVDINARENRLTGCAVITDGMSVVVVEGGSKSIKRYAKLMLRRINWESAVKEGEEEEEEDENEDKPVNKCLLVWQGSVAKSSFNRFSVHDCMTEAAARKILADAGVSHYWDLAANFSEDHL